MASIRARDARAGIMAGVRAAGPEFAMLAAFAGIATNLLDIATTPGPDEPVAVPLAVAAVVRVLLVFFAAYAIQRRMAGVPGALRVTGGFARFFLFSLIFGVLSGLLTALGAQYSERAGMDLAGRWLAVLGITALWGVLVVRLTAWGPALATEAGFRALPGLLRRLRGTGVPLAMAYLQVVLPFAAIHSALMLIGTQLPLSGNSFAALALIDGVVSAAQLLLGSALAVFAWRLADDRPEALRGAAAGR